MKRNQYLLPATLVGAGVATAVGFAFLARRVHAHDTRVIDARARRRFPKRRRRATKALATAIEPLGKWWGQMPLAAAASFVALRARKRGPRVATPIVGASAIAASLAWLLERTMFHRPPPPGRHSPSEPAFPSGHALQTSALAWTAAYIIARERMAGRMGAVPLVATLPFVSGLVKLYLDKHWFTDVAAGYLLGATIAATAAAGYEVAVSR